MQFSYTTMGSISFRLCKRHGTTSQPARSNTVQRPCGGTEKMKEITVRNRILLASALVLGFSGTAMADEYYVVQNPTTHHCTITTTKPADREIVTQIGPLAFKTREEADNRIRQTKVCSDETTGSSTTTIKEK
jgi:hypothetical protein